MPPNLPPETSDVPGDGLTYRSMSEADFDSLRIAFEASGSDKTAERVRWQYGETPLANRATRLAVDSNHRIGAVYASFSSMMKIGQEERVGAQSLDTLTIEDFRGKGLFKALAGQAYDQLDDDGAALIYGFPNGNSAHGFFNRLGWQQLDPVPFLVKPLRSRYVLSRIPVLAKTLSKLPTISLTRRREPTLPSGWRIDEVVDFSDPSFDVVVEEHLSKFQVALRRDQSYLQWRFINNPSFEYRILTLRDNQADLCAFIVFSVQKKHGGTIGYIMELMARPSMAEQAVGLLRAAVNEMYKAGCDVSLAWCFEHSFTRSTFRKLHYFGLPMRLRPIELHFGARAFDRTVADIVEARSSWYLSYADSDTV